MKKRSDKRRQPAGSVIAEAPVVLWILLFVVAFPLINLTTMFIRLSFLYAATHTACIQAARAKTYQASINSAPTALSLAQSGIDAVVASFTGIHVVQHSTAIVITDITTQAQTMQTAPLTTPADVSSFVYQVQVTTNGTADPLLPIPWPVSVAGFNAPLNVTFSDRQYFENPQGLTY
jgi:hypothetical protein